LRVSELCALQIGDVFVADGRGDVLVRRGKGGRSRLVAISTQLGEFVVKFISWKARAGQSTDGTAPLFTSQRWGHLTPSAVHRVWKAALVSAGLPSHYGVHATRHTFAVALYRATRDLRLVQRQLGHASVVTTTVYADLCDEDLRQGVEQLWK
jgi:site-specific recombinase XerD